jgi:hypothetical protein
MIKESEAVDHARLLCDKKARELIDLVSAQHRDEALLGLKRCIQTGEQRRRLRELLDATDQYFILNGALK